jgi:hypothetical protein
MGDFSADWLARREPADRASRSTALVGLAAASLQGVPAADSIDVIDLGAGTGANARFLLEHLPGRQEWRLVDRDAALLAELPLRMKGWAAERGYECGVTGDRLDIQGPAFRASLRAQQLDFALLRDELFPGAWTMPSRRGRLVTASALLDLVSEPWLESLAERCQEDGAAALFALSYDGRLVCFPQEPEDEHVRELINRHQRTDKGFGPALGPAASACAERVFRDRGYQIHRDRTDWALGPVDEELQRDLIEGWAGAATEMDPRSGEAIAAWRIRRFGHLADGRSRIIVGHEDLVAVLPQR